MKHVNLPLYLSLVALLATGCSRHPAESGHETVPALPVARVHTTTMRFQDLPAMVETTGSIRPVQRATISPKVMGTIEEIPIVLGQRVKGGDVLTRISASEISARVVQAQAQLSQTQRDLARERSLLEKSASTADMVKSLEDRVSMTAAMVREAEVMLGYTIIRAPFDGRIARKMANAGDLAAPGVPLLEVEADDRFEIEAGVPDSLAGSIALGMKLLVEIPATDVAFEGAVTEISSAADAEARTVPIKIAVPDGVSSRSGQFARVHVPGAAVRTLLVPAAAVSRLGQLDRIFVVAEGRVQLRLVKTGATHGPTTEILAGLDDGETIVVDPPSGLREGQPVEILP